MSRHRVVAFASVFCLLAVTLYPTAQVLAAPPPQGLYQSASMKESSHSIAGTADSASIQSTPQHRHFMSSAQTQAIQPDSAIFLVLASTSESSQDMYARTWLDLPSYRHVKAQAMESAPRHSGQPALTQDEPSLHAPTTFEGIQSSTSVCPPRGCNPPDMALAASSHWVFQGVNKSFAVFDLAGHQQPGWPRTFVQFFGIPNPGACAGDLAFTSDPRAFYDSRTQHFWAAALEVEGALGVNNCPFTTRYWIAVSETDDPSGAWNVYAFDMSLDTSNAADFTMVGFDSEAVYFSANMYDQTGATFAYAEIFAASKAQMIAGEDVVAHGFSKLAVHGPGGTFAVDSVHPALGEGQSSASVGQPEYFVNTFNGFDPVTGHGCTGADDACSGLAVWKFYDALTSPTLTVAYVPTASYTFPPAADETTCTACVDSGDLRISAPPIFDGNFLYAAWATGVDNGEQVVPGIVWSQIKPNRETTPELGAVQVQGGYFNLTSDGAALYPALMPDSMGNVYMVYYHMSHVIDPELRMTLQHGTDFVAPGTLLHGGIAPFNPARCGSILPGGGHLVCRWGDYSAAAYSGFPSNTVWLAGEYASAGTFLNWGTTIAHIDMP